MFINLTPHVIKVEDYTGNIISFEPTEPAAKIKVEQEFFETGNFRFSFTNFGEIENLPEPQKHVIFITSLIVAQKAKRIDVVSPDIGPTAERIDGQIDFVRGFVIHSK